MPEDALWLSLLLFNVGIELGQLAIIAVVLVLMRLATFAFSVESAVKLGAYGMGMMAAFWTIDRTLLLL